MHRIVTNSGLQTVHSFHILASDKNVHMLADLSLLIKDSIAERGMEFPECVEYVGDGIAILLESDLGMAPGEVLEMTGKVDGYRH